MKKILILLLSVFALSTASAQAQESGRFGARVSWDLNCPSSNVSAFGNGSGFSLGAVYDIPIYNALYFEPGLSFFYNTFSVDGTILSALSVEGSLRNIGFRIPFMAAYRFDFTDDIALSVFTGPQLNIGLSMKEHYNVANSVETNEQLYGDGFHRLDLQWIFGVRLHYADHFFGEISGGPGITNILGGSQYDGSHLRRDIVSIGIGYLF